MSRGTTPEGSCGQIRVAVSRFNRFNLTAVCESWRARDALALARGTRRGIERAAATLVRLCRRHLRTEMVDGATAHVQSNAESWIRLRLGLGPGLGLRLWLGLWLGLGPGLGLGLGLELGGG